MAQGGRFYCVGELFRVAGRRASGSHELSYDLSHSDAMRMGRDEDGTRRCLARDTPGAWIHTISSNK